MNNQPWNTYPRPQMKRDSFFCLNGAWTLDHQPITVPYPPQSALSEFGKAVPEQFSYEKNFTLPVDFTKPVTILHFGAVDQIAEVWLNDTFLGKHEGGYLPFSFDVSNCVKKDEENHLLVKVTDKLDKTYPYGKQTKKPGGMWYTPVSGIWQSVWMENLPQQYIKDMKLECDTQGITITVFGAEEFTAVVEGKEYHFKANKGRIEPENPQLWSPKHPYLYNLTIRSGDDEIESYFALRSIAISNHSGIQRVMLNGEPIFLHGVLDQGYFHDGLFLPKEAEEYERDVLRMKELGLNLLRKHIKIEPELFYYYCDKHGMLVMQDMVNNGSYSFLRDTALPTIGLQKLPDTLTSVHSKRKDFFRQHMMDTIGHLYNHPSVIAYTIFNEGWGQFHSDQLYELAKLLDPSRLYDSTSGWFTQKLNDFDSQHIYFRTKKLQYVNRPVFVSECGGYTMAVEGHRFRKDKQYGYGACENTAQLTEKITEMYQKMIFPAIHEGCCGCIYTQLSDVEEEINGLYTYDRQICKVDKETMGMISRKIDYAMRSL